jgi:hypothetical protein
MSSQRKAIRQAIAELLTDKTDADDKVYPFRVRRIFEGELPCILIYTRSEPVRVFTEAPREYERNLSLVIEILAKADETLDDMLDDIADDVEYWMHQDHTQGGLCGDTNLKSTEVTITPQGDTLIGSAVLTYEMPYYTEAVRDPDDLDNFNAANIKIQLYSTDNAASGIDSEDTLDPVTGGI